MLARSLGFAILDWWRLYAIQDDALAARIGNYQHLCRQDCVERDEKGQTGQASISSELDRLLSIQTIETIMECKTETTILKH